MDRSTSVAAALAVSLLLLSQSGGIASSGEEAQHLTSVEPARTLTLADAIETAQRNNLALRIAAADLEAARGLVQGARVILRDNPELEAEVADRSSGDECATDYGFSLSQKLDVAGERRHRVAAAESELASAEAAYEHLRLQVSSEVRVAFVDALLAMRSAGFARESSKLSEKMLGLVRERLEAGDTTDLEVNLAVIEHGRARRALMLAELDQRETLAALRQLMAIPETESIALAGDVEVPGSLALQLDTLVQRALAARDDLKGLRHAGEARDAEVHLARKSRLPELSVSAGYEREEETDDIYGVGVSVSLPLFNRGKGKIAEARARSARAGLEVQRGALEVERQVAEAYRRYQAARGFVEIYDREILGRVADNLELLRLSFEAGKIGLVQLIAVQREVTEARREYLESLGELHRARAALEIAVGGNL